MKKMISVILISCLCLTACAGQSKTTMLSGNRGTNGTETTQAVTPTPTVDPVAVEEGVINDFYNAMCKVRKDLAKYKYITVVDEVEKLRNPFQKFKEQQQNQTGKYQKYFSTIMDSNAFQYINDTFIESEKNLDKDKIKQKSYALILQNCLEMLLKEKMPIKSQKNVAMMKKLNRHYSDKKNRNGALKLIKAYIRTGLKAFDDGNKADHLYCSSRKMETRISKESNIKPKIGIGTQDDSRTFEIYYSGINFKNSVSNFYFISGKQKIKLRKKTKEIFRGFVGKGYTYNPAPIYDSDVDPGKNKSYEKVKKLFSQNKEVTVKIGNTIVKKYNKKEVKEMNVYFTAFDIILELYS